MELAEFGKAQTIKGFMRSCDDLIINVYSHLMLSLWTFTDFAKPQL